MKGKEFSPAVCRAVALIVILGAAGLAPATAATRIGPEFLVNTFTYASQMDPQIAHDGLGNFVVVWTSRTQEGGSDYGVYGQRYNGAGQPLGPEFHVNTTTLYNQISPAVACAPSGEFVVAWESDGDIYAQRYAGNGARAGGEFLVNLFRQEMQQTPAVSVVWDGTNGFLVAWATYGQDGSDFAVYAQRFDSAGARLGDAFRVNTYTLNGQSGPSLSHDAQGNFVILWTSYGQDGNAQGVYGQRYNSAGVRQGGEFRVNSYTAGAQEYPCVDHDPQGNFVVVWASYGQDGSSWGVYGRRYDSAGNPLGSEFRINTATAGAQKNASVACDPWGNFVVVWASNPNGEDDVTVDTFGQAFDSAGLPIGGEFQVNTYTAGSQRPEFSSRNVSFGPDGRFVVAWQSNGQDTSGWGIYGQRFGAVGATVSGTVTSDCDGPMAGVTIALAPAAGLPISTVTGADGAYAFPGVSPDVAYDVSVVLPEDFVAVTPESGIVHLADLSVNSVADFGLGCLFDVAGTVACDCRGPLGGITVSLLAASDYPAVQTTEDGAYRFNDLRYGTPIELTCVLPLGFHAISPVDGHVSLTVSRDETVDFALGCVPSTGVARGMGYWKHQATVYLKGKGDAQESEADMETNFALTIFEHFHDHELGAIQVAGVTYRGNPTHAPVDLATIQATLTVNGGQNMLARAKQHYMALMLNMASGKLQTFSVISRDGRTASEVVQYVADLINDGVASNDERAKDICETLNEAQLLGPGVVPEGYVPIFYRRALGADRPLSFSPNPAGALGTIVSFGMPVAGRAELMIFDVTGRKVASLLSGELQAGQVRLQWQGRGDDGAPLPKGIYSARLVTAQGMKTARLVQLGR